MKTTLALHHGGLPPNLHFDNPNPHIDFDALKLKVVDTQDAFPDGPKRYAGVSSFGFGGTNAHLALSEAPGRALRVVALAADSKDGLQEKAKSLAGELLGLRDDEAMSRIATRQHGDGDHRLTLTGKELADFESGLREVIRGELGVTKAKAASERKTTFVFAGQGGQWAGMVQDLLGREPLFQKALGRCDEAIFALTGWSVRELLALPVDGENAHLSSTAHIQPLVFSVQVSLAHTLMSWGLKPDAVLGQSMGEVAAAVVAGALTIEEGALIIVTRSRLATEHASGDGAMAVVPLSEEQLEDLLASHEDVCVAVHLAPQSVVLSGRESAVETLLQDLEKAGHEVQRVRVDYASHSPEMDSLLPELRTALSSINSKPPHLPMWSSVNNRWVEQALDADYWCANLRQPVQLRQSVQALCAEGFSNFIEVGPHPVAHRSIEATLKELHVSAHMMVSCWRGESAGDGLRELAARLWCMGSEIDWASVSGKRSAELEGPYLPLVLSAKNEDALRAQALRWSEWLLEHPETGWSDVVYSAALERTHFASRAAVVASNHQDAASALKALAEAQSTQDLFLGNKLSAGPLAVLFTGQGSQRLAMGRSLYGRDGFESFTEAFDAALAACDVHLNVSLKDLMWASKNGDATLVGLPQTQYTQPALFALETALYRFWEHCGVEPKVLAGHSIGS